MAIEFLALNAEFEVRFPALRVTRELLQADFEIEPLLLRKPFAITNLSVVMDGDGEVRELKPRRHSGRIDDLVNRVRKPNVRRIPEQAYQWIVHISRIGTCFRVGAVIR